MSRPLEAITKILSDSDLNTLMTAAAGASDREELWRAAEPGLAAPARISRRTAFSVFCGWYLDGEEPRLEAPVRAWRSFSDMQIRREVLHIERCRHLPVLDDMLEEVIYARLMQGPEMLFGDRRQAISNAAMDAYLARRLAGYTASTRRSTRIKVRRLLTQAGLAREVGQPGRGDLIVEYGRPSWVGWVYAVYREYGDLGQRRRAEAWLLNEARTTRRLLLPPAIAAPLLAEAVRQGVLERESFAGETYLRLVMADTAELVRTLGQGD